MHEIVSSAHKHDLHSELAGTHVQVTISTIGGDSELARDFADQLAAVVERKLRRMAQGEAAEGAQPVVLSFPLRQRS